MANNNLPPKTVPLKIGPLFENPWPTWKGLPSMWEVCKWQFTRKARNTMAEIEQELPVHSPNFLPTPSSGMIVTWIGHATVLVQIDGFNVITDPVFCQRCSPVGVFGPKRYRPLPCTVNQLPKINAVVISHNHYDHLDSTAVRDLHSRFGNDLRWFVPFGLAKWFRNHGVSNVTEMNWWESSRIRVESNHIGESENQELEIVFLPCQHWSLRGLFDRNLSLWGSWAAIGHTHRFYFAGDTGYCPEFVNIGAHYGPFDVSAIPIGCYLPRDTMRNQHISPFEAVQIHKDVRSKYSLGIHWGTYAMGSTESELAPKKDLIRAINEAGIQAYTFFTLNHGVSWTLPENI